MFGVHICFLGSAWWHSFKAALCHTDATREGEVIFLKAGGNSPAGSEPVTFIERHHSGTSSAVVNNSEYSLLLLPEVEKDSVVGFQQSLQ